MTTERRRMNLLQLIELHAKEAQEVGYLQGWQLCLAADSDEEADSTRELRIILKQKAKTWQRIQRLLGVTK